MNSTLFRRTADLLWTQRSKNSSTFPKCPLPKTEIRRNFSIVIADVIVEVIREVFACVIGGGLDVGSGGGDSAWDAI